ncbi:MAG: hypothetical protein DLM61_16155 [Pseudonocardiales bacterium]|nr:MAG: hypothetical protein DLM61_16155 [Pseudonocardiales bacterium]
MRLSQRPSPGPANTVPPDPEPTPNPGPGPVPTPPTPPDPVPTPPPTPDPPPPPQRQTVLGQEGVGVVEAVGRDVRGFRPGDRVVIPSTICCGTCAYCRAGYNSHCDSANPTVPQRARRSLVGLSPPVRSTGRRPASREFPLPRRISSGASRVIAVDNVASGWRWPDRKTPNRSTSAPRTRSQ